MSIQGGIILLIDDIYTPIGSRSLSHIKYFAKHLKIDKPSIIFLDNDYKLQKSNYENRERKNLTDNKFLGLISLDKSIGLDEIKTFALENPDHCSIINNNKNDSEDMLIKMNKVLQKFNSTLCI